MKKIATLFICVCLLVSVFSVFADEYNSASIMINDELVEIPEDYGKVMVIDGRTMVPIRFVLETFDFSFGWEETTQMVMCANPQYTIVFQIGSKKILIDKVMVEQKTIEMDVAPFLKDGRSYLPIRFLAEEIGYEVDWDETNSTVIINEK